MRDGVSLDAHRAVPYRLPHRIAARTLGRLTMTMSVTPARRLRPSIRPGTAAGAVQTPF